MLHRFIEYNQRCEIICANVKRTAQLCKVGALFAGVGMGRLFVFLMLRQILKSMMQCVRRPGLLGEQQDEGKQQWKEIDAKRLHGGLNHNKDAKAGSRKIMVEVCFHGQLFS